MLVRTAIAMAVSAVVLTALIAVMSSAWPPAVLGGAMALLGAAVGLLLCHRALAAKPEGSIHRSTNRLMAAFVASMLTRLVLLAASLAVSMVVLGWEPLTFVAAFFLVHLVSQVLEIRYLHRAGHGSPLLTS